MAEKLTMKQLSEELQQLRMQMQALEAQLERKFETRLASALAAAQSGKQSGSSAMPQAGIDTEQRQRLITDEAYLIAERRDFQGGDPAQDWVEAEKLVDYRLMQTSGPKQPATATAKPRKKTTRVAKKPAPAKRAAAKTSGSVKP